MRKIVVGIAVLLLSAAALIFWRLEDHDLSGRTSAPLSFIANGNRLSATVWLPEGRFLLEGRFAYAPGALDAITGFIEQAAVARRAVGTDRNKMISGGVSPN